MKLLFDEKQWGTEETVLALGTFDGLHRGHAALMAQARDLAALGGQRSAVFTFGSHPLAVLHPQKAPPMLTAPDEKARQVARIGVDALVMRRFDADFAALSPEMFVEHLVVALRPRGIVVGFNYSFGARGAGDAMLLRKLGDRHGFSVHVMRPVCWQGEPISSTRVREALLAGRMRAVRAMLGRHYAVTGEVIAGKRLGRTLGFPTANLALPQGQALPPFGVYAAWVSVGGRRYPSVLNLGAHPTAPGGSATIEAHLIGAELDLYGKRMRVELDAFLRPERKFADLNALKARIREDTRIAAGLLRTEEKMRWE